MNQDEIKGKHQDLGLTYKDYLRMQKNLSNYKIDKYYIYQQIGQGAFAQIYKGINEQTKTQVAVKVLNLRNIQSQTNLKVKKIRKRLAQEQSKIMMKFDCPNLLKCYQCFQNRDLKIMILQFCNQGSLQDRIDNQKVIPEAQAVSILKQIINGIGQCHKQKIIHRDLKADNILIHNGQCKIADFGFSKVLQITNQNDLSMNTVLGTMLTMAPEVMKRQTYGLKADIWSIGVIFFQMIFGQCPFKSNTSSQMIVQMVNYNLNTLQEYKGVRPSLEVRDFLKKVLVVDKQKRLGWKEVSQHEIFRVLQDSALPDNFHRNVGINVADTQLFQLEKEFILNSQKPDPQKTFDQYQLRQRTEQQSGKSQQTYKVEKKCKIQQISTFTQNELQQQYRIQPLQREYIFPGDKNLKQINQEQLAYSPQKDKRPQNKGYQNKGQQGSEPSQSQEEQTPQGQIVYPNFKKVNPSQMNLIKEKVNKQEENIYLWARKIHIECQKTQCIFNNVVKVIENQKLIDFKDRKMIQMMYLICTRCLNNISPISYEYERRKNNIVIKQLYDLVSKLYKQVTQRWLYYSCLLTKKQNQYGTMFLDWFSKKLYEQQIKQKDRFLTGIQSMAQFRNEGSEEKKTIQKKYSEIHQDDLLDYDKHQQIAFTSKYIQQNMKNLKFKQQEKQIRKYMMHFKDICNIQSEDLKDRTFKSYVKLLLL